MLARLQRSWELTKASARVVRTDTELLIFPLLSGLAILLVIGSFVVGALATGQVDPEAAQPESQAYAWLFLFYVIAYFIGFFFNTALVSAALIRMQGGNPTLADGLNAATARIPQIFGYAVMAATVGVALRALEERVGWVGRLVIGLMGASWTVATFLVVPVLVTRDVGPITAVRESAALLRKTWGENLIGNAGIGTVFGLANVAVILLTIGAVLLAARLDYAIGIASAVGLGVLAIVALATLQATLQGVYSAALYRHATGTEPTEEFPDALVAGAFGPRNGRAPGRLA